MKRFNLILAALAIFSISCQDQKKDSEDKENPNSEIEYSENKPESSKMSSEDKAERKESEHTGEFAENTGEANTKIQPISGDLYLKSGEEGDTTCKCYCLDVNPGGSSELCLAKDDIYITARFESKSDGMDLYYVSPSARNKNKKLPWDKFDKNTPIASLIPTSDGLKLDWKGFSINGELAVDYALYGKKTLEGDYKIKK